MKFSIWLYMSLILEILSLEMGRWVVCHFRLRWSIMRSDENVGRLETEDSLEIGLDVSLKWEVPWRRSLQLVKQRIVDMAEWWRVGGSQMLNKHNVIETSISGMHIPPLYIILHGLTLKELIDKRLDSYILQKTPRINLHSSQTTASVKIRTS